VFRFFVWLKALVKNRAHPEGSIAEGYKTEEDFFVQGSYKELHISQDHLETLNLQT